MKTIDDVLRSFAEDGSRAYGERVTQLAHALQSAALAERDGAAASLVAAALLHDIGHLVAKTPDGVDDRHEHIGAGLLDRLFGPAVAEPVRLHVDAKRYLCAVEAGYSETLSQASVASLALQGGAFSRDAAAAFAAREYSGDAARLRRWDDLAKVPNAPTRTLEAYVALLRGLAR